jgi:hypothetical protein
VTTVLRSVTLHGTLTGELWMPGIEAQPDLTVDLRADASRHVNVTGSGLVDAVKAAVDGAGDFRSARLTADSFVRIDHVWHVPYALNRQVTFEQCIDVLDLPSLSHWVAPDTYSYGEAD